MRPALSAIRSPRPHGPGPTPPTGADGTRRKAQDERGLTLLEVIVSLMLFSLMSTLLLGSQGAAAEAALDAQIERDIAFLLPFRLNAVALDPDEYDQDEMVGEFPATGVSSRLVDEEELFGTSYRGYTWKVERKEVIGAGSASTVRVAGNVAEMLFPEESNLGLPQDEEGQPTSSGDEDYDEVDTDAVDMMLFIRVTVYPPGYDPNEVPTQGRPGGPRSAWTAIILPKEEEEE
ncbi:MAG: type II secretion system protein [Planctomycetota bacterium]|nr:type II secretion system protein [Planctomycetota bacterium]